MAVFVHICGCGDFFATKPTEVQTQLVLNELRQIKENPNVNNPVPEIYRGPAKRLKVKDGVKLCYFTKQQAAGNMFNRGNAIECQRRARIVRPFELSEISRLGPQMHKRHVRALVNMLGEGPLTTDPTLSDLYRLCCEDIDIVLARDEFDGLYSEQIGPFFVYECGKIREAIELQLAQGKSHPQGGRAHAREAAGEAQLVATVDRRRAGVPGQLVEVHVGGVTGGGTASASGLEQVLEREIPCDS